MTFAADLAAIPYDARGTNAAGFNPPIFRAIGHILFAAAITADTEHPGTEAEIVAELAHAKDHWDVIPYPETISTPTAALVTAVGKAIASAHTEFPTWTGTARVDNLRGLANRTASLAAVLDRELLGLRDSDPGYQL